MGRRSPDSGDRRRRRSRSRDRHRDRHRDRRERERSRSRDRDRDKDREVYRERERELERARDGERAREHEGGGKGARPAAAPAGRSAPEAARETGQPGAKPEPGGGGGDDEAKRKAARLSKVAALLGKKGPGPPKEESAPEAVKKEEEEVWLPWEQQQPAVPAAFADMEEEGEQQERQGAAFKARLAAQRAKAAAELAEQALRAKQGVEEEDPLDAFMAAEVNPEVASNEAAAAAAKEEERRKMAQQLQNGKQALPTLQKLLEESDSDPDANPDREMQIPAHKVKLVVGPGGETIKVISRKSRCRLQIKREEDKLQQAFGAKSAVAEFAEKAQERAKAREGGSTRLVTLMFFGSARECDTAQRMVEEALDNREAKAKQREREYEKKREEKRRNRQIYTLCHTRDYEALEVPVGASRADVKAAYKKLARLWHPDKHPEDPEAAKERFQEIQRAYDSLMATEEDTRVEALAAQ